LIVAEPTAVEVGTEVGEEVRERWRHLVSRAFDAPSRIDATHEERDELDIRKRAQMFKHNGHAHLSVTSRTGVPLRAEPCRRGLLRTFVTRPLRVADVMGHNAHPDASKPDPRLRLFPTCVEAHTLG